QTLCDSTNPYDQHRTSSGEWHPARGFGSARVQVQTRQRQESHPGGTGANRIAKIAARLERGRDQLGALGASAGGWQRRCRTMAIRVSRKSCPPSGAKKV